MRSTSLGAIPSGPWRRWAAAATIRLLARLQLLWPFRRQAFMCEGMRGEHILRIACYGAKSDLEHVLQTMLPRPPLLISKAGRRDGEEAGKADLVIRTVNVFDTADPGWHRLPTHFRMVRQVENDDGQTSRVRYRERRAVATVEAAGVRFEEFRACSSPDMLKAFYRMLYSPHVRAIGGRVESLSRLKFLYPDGLLRLAFIDDALIAGSLFLESGDTLVSCKYGVLDHSDPVHRAAASLQVQIAYARRRGFRVFDGFHAGPFLADGVFPKREAGLRIRAESSAPSWRHDVAARFLRMSPTVMELLRSQPYIRVASDGLLVAVVAPAVDDGWVAGTLRAYARCKTDGVDRYEFVVSRAPTPAELSELHRRNQTLAELARFVVVPIDGDA